MTTKDEDIFCSTLLQLINAIRLELHNLNENIELSAKSGTEKTAEDVDARGAGVEFKG